MPAVRRVYKAPRPDAGADRTVPAGLLQLRRGNGRKAEDLDMVLDKTRAGGLTSRLFRYKFIIEV